MKILFAASEGVPFCKTGGLADVVGALPDVLAAKRHTVRLFLPLYRDVRERFPKIKFIGRTLNLSFDGRTEPVQIWQADVRANFRVYFAGSATFFDRPGIYGSHPGTSYPDNDRRYAFFSRAVFEMAKAVDFKPDIIHAHDWQTGLMMAHQKFHYSSDSFFAKTATLFTIHNLAYQGNFPAPSFHMTGLPARAYEPKGLEFYGKVSFLKAGLVYSDAINTVSPTYAKEISSDPVFGCGLEGVLRERSADFQGIVNGIDVKFWNPKTDPNLASAFDRENVEPRLRCKHDLQRLAGLNEEPNTPLLAFIGRLDHQKGIDLLIETLPAVLKKGAQFVSLGQGNIQYQKDLQQLQRMYPAQVYVKTDFAEPFAHKIYAGADIFLMPSRFEPCGLGQMIAMRYGAVPVVTPTGGLVDTVIDSGKSPSGTGFVAADLTAGAFLTAMRTAVEKWANKTEWRSLQQQGMSQDFSWRHSVKDYLMLYESILK